MTNDTFQLFQVDAFTDRLFGGNPAAVVPLERWLPDDVLQRIAMENNLSETAYLVPNGPGRWELRWFTPSIEVPLCGHATLASAFVLANVLNDPAEVMTFRTVQSGDLVVTREGRRFSMRLPRRNADGPGDLEAVAEVLGARPTEVLVVPAVADETLLAVFETEAAVRDLEPDFRAMAKLSARNVMATAPGTTADFVSRYFAPKGGIDEDPVTGSAHCGLVPYWHERTGRTEFHARQISRRGGELFCRLEADAVIVAGEAVLYMSGTFRL